MTRSREEATPPLLGPGEVWRDGDAVHVARFSGESDAEFRERVKEALRCEATAPAVHTQAGARCERPAHGPELNHKVAPRDGLPGAVWANEPAIRVTNVTVEGSMVTVNMLIPPLLAVELAEAGIIDLPGDR